jgi:hypothetical protein
VAAAAPEEEDPGRYFPNGAYFQLPSDFKVPNITVVGWFVWMDGDGPLLATSDDDWALLYDRDGRCAYRLGDVERVTSLPSTWCRGRWTFLALAKEGSEATLWVDDGVVDHWHDAPLDLPLGELTVMKEAVGFAADVVIFERRIPDERLHVFWKAGNRH